MDMVFAVSLNRMLLGFSAAAAFGKKSENMPDELGHVSRLGRGVVRRIRVGRIGGSDQREKTADRYHEKDLAANGRGKDQRILRQAINDQMNALAVLQNRFVQSNQLTDLIDPRSGGVDHQFGLNRE